MPPFSSQLLEIVFQPVESLVHNVPKSAIDFLAWPWAWIPPVRMYHDQLPHPGEVLVTTKETCSFPPVLEHIWDELVYNELEDAEHALDDVVCQRGHADVN